MKLKRPCDNLAELLGIHIACLFMDEFRLRILSSLKKNNMQDQALELIGFLSSEPIEIAQLFRAEVERAKVVKANRFVPWVAQG